MGFAGERPEWVHRARAANDPVTRYLPACSKIFTHTSPNQDVAALDTTVIWKTTPPVAPRPWGPKRRMPPKLRCVLRSFLLTDKVRPSPK